MFKTPILFLVFARPDTTAKVFERIRQIQPCRLYVAADAPRDNRPDEIKRSEETRRIFEQIDWPCEVYTLFREKNLGCKLAVSSAITWFFEKEEYGIILEDDCLPDLSFFPFCEELLIKYRDDDRIGHIGGNNFFKGIVSNEVSYDFCSFSHIWGWASWRRVWKNYDVNFSYWRDAQSNSFLKDSLFRNIREKIYFTSFIDDTLQNINGINTWDVQYLFMLRVQNQLSVYPQVNLVTNIGLNSPDATHTKGNSKYYIESEEIKLPLKHPRYILANKSIDICTVKNNFFSYKRLLRYMFNLL